jgi:hypothetical protein
VRESDFWGEGEGGGGEGGRGYGAVVGVKYFYNYLRMLESLFAGFEI